MTTDSRELQGAIRKAQRGDGQAFEVLLSYVEEPVWRLTFLLLRHKEDAEDAAQETLLKLWRTLPSYRFECPILPYVLRMARNTVIDMQRRRQKQWESTTSFSTQNEQGEWTMLDLPDPDEAADPVRSYEKKERILAVRAALDELPDECREILVMKDMQNLSYEQIALSLDVPDGTVKSRLYRARKKLADILRDRNIF